MLKNTLPSLCNYDWHVLEQVTYSKLQRYSYLLANKRLVLLVSSHHQVLKVSFLLYQGRISRQIHFKGLVELEFKTYTRSRAVNAGLLLHRSQCDENMSAQMSNERQFSEIFGMTRYDCSCSFSLPTLSPSKMWTLCVCVLIIMVWWGLA